MILIKKAKAVSHSASYSNAKSVQRSKASAQLLVTNAATFPNTTALVAELNANADALTKTELDLQKSKDSVAMYLAKVKADRKALDGTQKKLVEAVNAVAQGDETIIKLAGCDIEATGPTGPIVVNPPSFVGATAGITAGTVLLQFVTAKGGAKYYKIRFSTDSQATWTSYWKEPQKAVHAFEMTGLPSATTVFLQIQSIGKDGTPSAWSPSKYCIVP
jgi:hypothetical protein